MPFPDGVTGPEARKKIGEENELSRKFMKILFAGLFLCLAAGRPIQASAQEQKEKAEWTVMVYICGSDLESRYGYASDILAEITDTFSLNLTLTQILTANGLTYAGAEHLSDESSVNVVAQTGGASDWHWEEKLPVEIKSDVLQRWQILLSEEDPEKSIRLIEEKPLESMAEPDTLGDFIRWSAEAAPAEKYALVVWGHGGGAKTGLFYDELFMNRNDIMRLNSLGTALESGGVHFEMILFDACMMANLETACAISPYADWMVASEELVPGKGTAMGPWLQELAINPYCSGREIGRAICDLTLKKYSDLNDEQAEDTLTWSVIRLDRIGRLAEYFDNLFQGLNNAYLESPSILAGIMTLDIEAEKYGNGTDGMVDLGSVICNPKSVFYLDREYRSEIIKALNDAVDYNLKGPGRGSAHGLSFCFAARFLEDELETYFDNCPSPHYLAFLDAICGWDANSSLYRKVKKLPEMAQLDYYIIRLEKTLYDGIPAFFSELYNSRISYNLYRYDEESGECVLMGKRPGSFGTSEDGRFVFSAGKLMTGVAIDGQFCDAELISESNTTYVYNIPIRIGRRNLNLRLGQELDFMKLAQEDLEFEDCVNYEVYGIWSGYDSHSNMPNRNVYSLSQVAGQEYRLLYPIDKKLSWERESYLESETLTMKRIPEISVLPLPAGTYYLEYEIGDIFGRSIVIDRIELHWDGQTVSYPEGFEWSGQLDMTVLGMIDNEELSAAETPR